MSSRILYKSHTYDPETQLPIYILDSFFLPSSLLVSELIKSDEELLNFLISKIEEDFALIILSSSFNKIESKNDKLNLPIKLIKLFKSIPTVKVNLLHKIYIVHHNWLTKSLLDLLNVVRFTPTRIRITHCDTLTLLSRYLDITKLNISLPTYLYDLNFNHKIIIPIHLKPVFQTPIILENKETVKNFKRLFNKLIDYLDDGDYGDLPMLLNTSLSRLSQNKVDILIDCIKRNQILNLSDWSFVEVFKVLVEFLETLNDINQPLIPVSLIIEDQNINELLKYEYNSQGLSYNNKYVINKVFKLFQVITSKFDEEKHKLLFILELSKNLYNFNYSTTEDDHSKIFNKFFEFLKMVLLEPVNVSQLRQFKIDEGEWINYKAIIPNTPPKVRTINKLIEDDVKLPPTPPLPRKLQKMTINDNNSLTSVTSDEEEDGNKVREFTNEYYDDKEEEEKENYLVSKPRYERLVKLTKPMIEQKQEMDKIVKEIKLKPWVKGEKVGKLAIFFEQEME